MIPQKKGLKKFVLFVKKPNVLKIKDLLLWKGH